MRQLNASIMAQIIALKCPSCGAHLEKNEMKCQYCGAELVLLPDNSAFSLRSQSACPKCGSINEKSSWFCLNCNTILTKDTEMLKRIQKKAKFNQEENEKLFASKVPLQISLAPDEFFHMTFSKEQVKNFYAVTNKRVMQYVNGKYNEISISDIVAVYPPKAKPKLSKSSLVLLAFVPTPLNFETRFEIEIKTYHGLEKLEEIRGDPYYCGLFYAIILRTVEEYEKGTKNVLHFIMKLPLDE